MQVWLYVFAHAEKIYKRINTIVYRCCCWNFGSNRVFKGKGRFAFILCTYKIVCFFVFPSTIRNYCFCNLFSWNGVLGYNSLTSTRSYLTLQTLPFSSIKQKHNCFPCHSELFWYPGWNKDHKSVFKSIKLLMQMWGISIKRNFCCLGEATLGQWADIFPVPTSLHKIPWRAQLSRESSAPLLWHTSLSPSLSGPLSYESLFPVPGQYVTSTLAPIHQLDFEFIHHFGDFWISFSWLHSVII